MNDGGNVRVKLNASARVSLIAKAAMLVLLVALTGCKPKAAPKAVSAEPEMPVLTTNDLRAQVDAKLAAIRQAGYPVTLEEMMRWLPAVPDAENQALLLTNAFAACVYVKDVPEMPARNVRLPALTKRWFEYEAKTNQVALQRLREAARLTRARYPVDWAQGWGTTLRHLGDANHLVYLLEREAALHTENKRIDKAVDSIAMIGLLARSLDQEPCLVSQLCRTRMLYRGRQATERLLTQTRPAESHLSTLQRLFSDNQVTEPFTRALVSERCFGLDLFQQPKEKFVALMKELDEWRRETNNIGAKAEAFVANRDADYLFYLDAMDTLIAASEMPELWKAMAIARSIKTQLGVLQDEPIGRQLVASVEMLSPRVGEEQFGGRLPMAFDRITQSSAVLRTAETALAVERYRLANRGQLPSDLNALTPDLLLRVPADPFDGRPLRYTRLAKGYVVYSVGIDGQDNGGKESERALKASEDGTDITFIVER
jgi:hypothetical protein